MVEDRRPIKVIPHQSKHFRAPSPGGSTKIFPTQPDLVDRIDSQLLSLEHHFGAALSDGAFPVVARVTLRRDALAKSHRPEILFNDNTCPIIGTEYFGELLVSVRKLGLNALRKELRRTTKKHQAALSTLESVLPYSATADADTLKGDGPITLKVRLFNHRDAQENAKLERSFVSLIKAMDIPRSKPLSYATGLRLYRLNVDGNRPDAIVALAHFAGIQQVCEMPTYEVDTQAIYVAAATSEMLPPPDPEVTYPIVGLLDSGTDRHNPDLEAWIVGRDEEDVPLADQNNVHGSFVAGLLVNARGLNHNDPRFPPHRCKVFDAVIHSKAGHSEEALIDSIRRVIGKHHEIKVWNLSISGVKNTCVDYRFSDFAMAIDEIQDEFDVTIVTCTGNTKHPHLRRWPSPTGSMGENDRMFPAADSVRAISVGAIAHLDRHDSLAKAEEPSPFSRRGPGPSFLPKPDVSHYGGNCSATNTCHQLGILSVDNTQMIIEKAGTSFSTPLVSVTLASLRQAVTSPVSRNLAKALMIQSAVLGGPALDTEHLHYRGFGIPGKLDHLFNCQSWQATLIFEPEFDPIRRIFEMPSFPIPNCFRRVDGTVEGEFIMTLVYDPPLDTNGAAEYCRINVDAKLGSYDLGIDGKRHHRGKIPLEPVSLKELYESDQIKHGFKWSPVKVYRNILEGEEGQMWAIGLRMFYRSSDDFGQPQNVALVLTMQDPKKKGDVYNQVVREMNANGWVTQDLQTRPRLRLD